MLQNILVWFIQFSPKTKKWFWRKWYSVFPRIAPDPKFKCMNFGYFSDNLKLVLGSDDELERYPIQLYHHVASQADVKGKFILEVGSGRGGGADYIARNLGPAQITGLDISNTAIDFCNSVYKQENLRFVVGDSENIPLGENSFDIVINVESSHCYGSMEKFLTEVKRVLKPEGYFLFCDLRMTEKVETLNKELEESGLALVQKNDITDNVIRGLEQMSDSRKKRINRAVPFGIKSIFESYAGVRGSKTYESFVNGSLVYISALLQKPIK